MKTAAHWIWPALVLSLLVAGVRLLRIAAAGEPPAADFYVSPQGNDRWSGTRPAPNAGGTDGPFATLARAQKAVRELKRRTRDRSGPIEVLLRAGTYYLDAPLTFGAEDSGTAATRIVYEAYPGEAPVVSGGRPVTGWKLATGGRWQASARGLQYFEQLWVNGNRRARPRTTPNGYLYIDGPVYASSPSEACRPAMQRGGFGRPGAQGRGGFGRPGFGRLGFPGPFGQRFPGGRQPQAGAGQYPGRNPGQRPGQESQSGYECFDRFRYKGEDLVPGWAHPNDIEIIDFEQWTVSRLRLKSVDPGEHIAYMTGWTNRAGRFFGFLAGHRYLVENVKEALSQPGQWYLERDTSELTYIPEPGETAARAEVIAPQLEQLIVAHNLDYVTFKGLTFSHTNLVVPPEGYRSNQGELRVPAALSFVDSGSIVIDSCVIGHVGGWGIEFRGAGPWSRQDGYNDQVVNSELTDLGAGGIRIGFEPGYGDTEANVAQHDLVKNTVISGGGRILPQGCGIWIGNAHDNLISHNEIYDFYNNGMNLGHSLNYIGSLTHDNVIEFNDIHQLGQGVTNDIGAIHTVSSTATGNKILNNKFHDIAADPGQGGYGGWAIYFDQGTTGVLAKNNLVYRVSQSGFHQNTGENNEVTNNIFAFGKAAVERSNNEEHLSFTFSHNIVYWYQGSPLRGFWACTDRQTFAEVPCSSRFLLDSNLYWKAGGGDVTFVGGRNPLNPQEFSLKRWQDLGEDVHSMVADPLFVDPTFPADNFALRPGSPALKVGFAPFDASEAGRLPGAKLMPAALPPAYPLQAPDPRTGY